MKKFISVFLAVAMVLGAVPVLVSAVEPYTVTGVGGDEEKVSVTVKANSDYSGDFTLYAALCDGEMVYDATAYTKDQLLTETEISFPTIEGANISLYAWEGEMKPVASSFTGFEKALTYESVMSQLRYANDYWIRKNSSLRYGSNPWEVGVYHTGNMQAYYLTGDELYRNYSTFWSQANGWQSYYYPVESKTHADNLACFQTYIDLYNIDKDEDYIEYVKTQIDNITNSIYLNYWDWVDAFYMAAPIFTKMYTLTGEEKYLDKMYDMIYYNANNLRCYDEEEGLWYRDNRFVDTLSENGKKIFWSRGNGWVFAAIARIIEDLPDSYDKKQDFVDVFCAMAEALKNCQCSDGGWPESLLDYEYHPASEESGTGFFVYGLLWGINNGYLPEAEYIEAATKGWKWLSEVALQPDGSVGYVQHIGHAPTLVELTKESTQHYAYANFVFAAGEMAKYLGGVQGDILPMLQKKLLGRTEAYKLNSCYSIKNGEIVTSAKPFLKEENGVVKVFDNGVYNTLNSYLSDGMYVYEKDGVYVISEYKAPFNKTEGNLVKMLSDILDEGKFPSRPYSDPDRIALTKIEKLPDADDVENLLIIPVDNITVSELPEPNNGPANLVDRNILTRYAASVEDDEPEYIDINLVHGYRINEIGISFNSGDTRTTEFEVAVSEDGVNYTTVVEKQNSSGTTLDIEYYKFDTVFAKYVRIYGYGNSSIGSSKWFSPTEIEIYSPDGKAYVPNVNTDTEEPVNPPAEQPDLTGLTEAQLNASDVTASIIAQPQNGPGNVIDGDFSSYCALYVSDQQNPEYIQLDLGEMLDVAYVAIAFLNGNTRTSDFYISVSDDGVNYTTVVPRSTSSGATETFEYFAIDRPSRYVRIYGYGNSVNPTWFSVTETKVYITQ